MLVTDHSLIVKGHPLTAEFMQALCPTARSLLIDAAITAGTFDKPFRAGPAIIDTDDIEGIKEIVRDMIIKSAGTEERNKLMEAAIDISHVGILCRQHQIDFLELYVQPDHQFQ